MRNCDRIRPVLTGVVVRRDGCAGCHVLDEDGARAAVLRERLFQMEAPLVPPSFGRHLGGSFFLLCVARLLIYDGRSEGFGTHKDEYRGWPARPLFILDDSLASDLDSAG